MDQEKIRTDAKLAALKKQLEEEEQRNAEKAKELVEAKERLKSAINPAIKSALVNPEVLLVPQPTAAASPSDSSTSTSRPSDDSKTRKDAQAAKKPFRHNRGRR